MTPKQSNGYIQTRLRNGLEVRLKEIHTAPLVSSWIWYRVGSRNEIPGSTGISHWLEHMQFKGTPTFPGGILDRAISRDGGFWNAMTGLDWTAYFETMPADRIDLALRLEADRMINTKFLEEEVESERTVIISERQGHENEPTFLLSEEIDAAAFRVHSYHHRVIGDMIDLQTIKRDDLYAHYQRNYVPSNAILTVAGDFRAGTMLKRVRELFGPISKQPRPKTLIRPEPPQLGERRVTVEGPGQTPFLKVAYHAPIATDPDFLPLAVLGSVLAGAASFNFSAGGISNKTSRLYRALVEGEVAASIRGGMATTIDPYLYTLHVTIRPDCTPEQNLEIIDKELTKVREELLDKDELTKAMKQAKALFAYGSESITNQAFWMGFSEMFAEWSWYETFLDRLVEVTPEQIVAVAQKYLAPTNRVVGIYRPTSEVSDG